MRIVVIGAGGTGGYFGGLLARAGEDVSFLAHGTQLEALRTHGLTVKSRLAGTFSLPVHATSDPQEIGPVDLVLFCVKTYDTQAASEGLHLFMGPQTVVLPIQNGIDAAEQLSGEVGMQHLVGGVAYVTSHIESPGVIAQTAGARSIELGELAGGQSERTERLQQVLRHASISAQLPPDIGVTLWEKFLFICAFSGVTALTRLPLGQVLAYPETSELLKAVMKEGEAVSRASGMLCLLISLSGAMRRCRRWNRRRWGRWPLICWPGVGWKSRPSMGRWCAWGKSTACPYRSITPFMRHSSRIPMEHSGEYERSWNTSG